MVRSRGWMALAVCCAMGLTALGGGAAQAGHPQVVVSSTAVVSPLVIATQPQFVVQAVNVQPVAVQAFALQTQVVQQPVVVQQVVRQQVRVLGSTRVVVRGLRCR